jgi:hypothetical protein
MPITQPPAPKPVAMLHTKQSARIPAPTPLPAAPLSPEAENALINRLQTHTKHETLLTDILNTLDVAPADAAKLGAAVKAAFERLVIMQQQPKFRTSFSWNLNALADRIRDKFNIEVSPDVIKKVDAPTQDETSARREQTNVTPPQTREDRAKQRRQQMQPGSKNKGSRHVKKQKTKTTVGQSK